MALWIKLHDANKMHKKKKKQKKRAAIGNDTTSHPGTAQLRKCSCRVLWKSHKWPLSFASFDAKWRLEPAETIVSVRYVTLTL